MRDHTFVLSSLPSLKRQPQKTPSLRSGVPFGCVIQPLSRLAPASITTLQAHEISRCAECFGMYMRVCVCVCVHLTTCRCVVCRVCFIASFYHVHAYVPAQEWPNGSMIAFDSHLHPLFLLPLPCFSLHQPIRSLRPQQVGVLAVRAQQ